jgi:hypothetical protein
MAVTSFAQPTPEAKTDVSNKALITKAAPTIAPPAKPAGDVATLRKMAEDYYAWRNETIRSAAAIRDFTPGMIA